MQIHELPSASPSASDYIPIDNGTATRKATLSSIDMGSNEITFTSGDTSSPSSWQTVAVMASNTAANLMNAISKMVANIRWLYNRLGTSSTGTTATTVTGAIAEHSTKIGSAEMGTTATTLTGAIAEVNDSVNDNAEAISELNSNLSTITPYTITTASGYASFVSSNLISCYKRSDGMAFVFGSFTLSSAIPSAAAANIFEGFPVSRFGSVWVSIMHVSTKETLRIQFRNGSASASLQENYTAYASGEYVVLPFSYLS